MSLNAEEPRNLPSFLQLQQQNSSENQEIDGFYDEKNSANNAESLQNCFLDLLTEKQYENFAENLRKKASSLETEDHWELVKKNIKKPKKMKVVRTSLRCRICASRLRLNSIIHRFSCFHLCHEECTLFFRRESDECPVCARESKRKSGKPKKLLRKNAV